MALKFALPNTAERLEEALGAGSGATGATGPAGPTGPTGPTGATGASGGGDSPVAPVAAGATLSVTSAHHRKIILLDQASGSVCTLPAATGTGLALCFIVSVAITSNAHIVKVADNTDIIQGSVMATLAGNAVDGFFGAADTDTITLNGTTGGAKGDYITLIDIATNLWAVSGFLVAGDFGNPFSATV